LTTMYARLVLSDLFLHGIGGGKYDQLGDVIIQKFFGIEPPRFMVISATVRLPGFSESEREGESEQERARLKRSIRDTWYQGERFADQANLSKGDIEQKHRLLAKIPPPGSRREWQRELEQVNGRLANELSQVRADLQLQLANANRKQATDTLMSSREHPFCLFPIDYLTEIYGSLLS